MIPQNNYARGWWYFHEGVWVVSLHEFKNQKPKRGQIVDVCSKKYPSKLYRLEHCLKRMKNDWYEDSFWLVTAVEDLSDE